MDSTLERITSAIQDGVESILPEGIKTLVEITTNLPEAIKDAQDAIKHAQVISEYAAIRNNH